MSLVAHIHDPKHKQYVSPEQQAKIDADNEKKAYAAVEKARLNERRGARKNANA